jgi:protein-L-isoaspartate(D-aspartate) O-methyltransferase
VTAGAPVIPESLLQQLRIGGFLVAPIGSSEKQVMYKITRVSEDEFEKEKHGTFVFVPMLKGTVN